jgi:hypothetical protein
LFKPQKNRQLRRNYPDKSAAPRPMGTALGQTPSEDALVSRSATECHPDPQIDGRIYARHLFARGPMLSLSLSLTKAILERVTAGRTRQICAIFTNGDKRSPRAMTNRTERLQKIVFVRKRQCHGALQRHGPDVCRQGRPLIPSQDLARHPVARGNVTSWPAGRARGRAMTRR